MFSLDSMKFISTRFVRLMIGNSEKSIFWNPQSFWFLSKLMAMVKMTNRSDPILVNPSLEVIKCENRFDQRGPFS